MGKPSRHLEGGLTAAIQAGESGPGSGWWHSQHLCVDSVVRSLVLMEEPPSGDGPEGGSSSLRWWRRTRRIRTVAGVPLEATLEETEVRPLYQRVARKVQHLRGLGLSYCAIAERLEVDDKTAAKASRWLRSLPP